MMLLQLSMSEIIVSATNNGGGTAVDFVCKKETSIFAPLCEILKRK